MPTDISMLSGRYALGDPLATGGMATVYRARDSVLARTVAVKILHEHLAEDEDFLQRFRKEAIAAARLGHPHITSIYDTGSESGDPARHFIVMEFCGGGTLAQALEEEGRLEPGRVAQVGATLCDALGYAHAAGIVHRDVKPANVLLTEDRTLKLTDFGIAKAAFAAGDPSTTGKILGTARYLSPEQLAGDDPDGRSDLYSLGVLLYELTTGQVPFPGDSVAVALEHLRSEPVAPRAIRPGIPRSLEHVVMRALEKDPDKRWSSAHEMGVALSGARQQDATVAVPTRAPGRVRPEGERAAPATRGDTRWALPVLILVAVAVIAAIVVPGALRDEPDTGNRRSGGGNPTAGAPLDAVAESFDPHGDFDEHGEDAPLSVDGDPTTSWTTESYDSSLAAQEKPGVGLLIDLGSTVAISSVEVIGSAGYDIEIRAAEQEGSSEDDFDLIASQDAAGARTLFEDLDVDGARYVLVWITELPEEGGHASVAEVTVLGS